MSSLFRNNYKVYLYKYNYKALQSKVESILSENSVNKFLFESFVTNLYTLGIPSDEILKVKGNYNKYVNEFKNQKPNISNANKKVVENTGDSRTVEYKPINENSDFILKHERATISVEDNLLQEALAQNYALQKLQRDYEDDKMAPSSAKINWMSTIESRQTYDNYITNALEASKTLLDKLFEPVIDELASIQSSGILSSKYVYAIELTDLAQGKVIEKVETDRTKYSDDDFIRTTANRVLADDSNANAVDSIGAISTTLEGLSNMTSFNLRQDILLQHGITIEANDIIEIVDTNYNNVLQNNKNDIYQKLIDDTQFIGFVTKVSLSQRFSETSLLNVTCEGISKMLSLNPTINSNAVAPQFKSVAGFISGEDKTQTTSDANVVNVFSTFFDGLNAYDLFVKLLSDTLGVTPVEEDKTAYSMRLVSDPEKLKILPYQYAKPLLVLYHYAVTYSTLRKVNLSGAQGYGSHIILARLDNNVNQEKLQAYLLMIRSQFDLFWSNMTTPITVLQTLANNTFLEIFEDRSGVLILRPPRYNTWIEGDVIEEHNFIEWTQSIDDSSLKSRSDYQWSIPALGVQNEFCGGYYQDIPALLKYGFRIDSPKSSPSVQSEIDAAVYSALDVTKSNGNTRTFELTVPLTQEYKLGRLYYFPDSGSVSKNGTITSKGFVGYLTNIITTITPGNVDIHRLTFKYMRSAECIETNIKEEGGEEEGLTGKATTILNFKRLPELAMYQSTVTEDMLTKTQKDNLKKKERSLVSNSRYYWASYNNPNKIVFDNAIDRDSYISKSKYDSLYKTMAPTNIRVGTFKSLNDIKSSDFIPSQQLINSIWCADILSRTGYSENDYELNSRSVNINKDPVKSKSLSDLTIDTRVLRTRDSKYFLQFLQKDKTIKDIGEVNYIDKDSSKLSAPYATINTTINENNKNKSVGMFLISDSMLANINTEFAEDYYNVLVTYIRGAERAFNQYQSDPNFQEWYIDSFSSTNSNVVTIVNKVTDAVVKISGGTEYKNKLESGLIERYEKQMTDIKNCIDAFHTAENNLYKFDYFLDCYTASKSYIEKLVEYYEKQHNDSIFSMIKNIFESIPGMALATKLSDIIQNKQIYDSIKIGIPAYLVNASAQLPAVHTLKNTGAYIAGVCPIDYADYIKTLNQKIKDGLVNNSISFDSMDIKNALGNPIGTITKLIYDPKMSDDKNLYFYPVIDFKSDTELQKAYGGLTDGNARLKEHYMFSESEILDFIQNNKTGNDTKKLACVIRVTPTCIPETKIPTIEQIYNQDGLYVGYEYDVENDKGIVNTSKAIFDPSVLFKWNSSEVKKLYSVNIYNFIECCAGNSFAIYLSCNSKTNNGKSFKIKYDTIPWSNIIKNNTVWRVPCVSNTSLVLNNFEPPALSSELETVIRRYFMSLSLNTAYEIRNCNETNVDTGYMYIKDLVTKNTQLALTFNTNNNFSVARAVLIDDGVASSKTRLQNSSITTDFMQSVIDKEYTQVHLYQDGSYMPYSTKDWYPNCFTIGRTFILQNTLKLTLKRTLRDAEKTIGELYINGFKLCDTLEDTYREIKIPKETCIPNGYYQVILETSTKSKSGFLPLLLNVPNFTDIRIHTGTSIGDTDGCILVGDYKNNEWTANGRYVTDLMRAIQSYKETFIDILLA